MNTEEATQHALGYAAGREDASNIKTAEPTERPGFLAFADAYASAWDAYNTGERFFMTNARDAYETWQRTGGQTIFHDGACSGTPARNPAHDFSVRKMFAGTPYVACSVCKQSHAATAEDPYTGRRDPDADACAAGCSHGDSEDD